MRCLIVSVLLLILPLALLAQTQDPGSPPPNDSTRQKAKAADSTHHTDTVHYHYSYAGTGIANSTNSSSSFLLNNALKLSMVKQSATVDFNNNWVYGKQDRIVTNNDFSSSLDADLYKTLRHFYYWAMVGYNTSISLRINHQEQAALGPGYNLIDKKKAVLILSDGPLYEKGDLYDSLYSPTGTILQRDRYQVFRNSFRLLLHWVIRDIYTLDGVWFLQNAFDNWDDYNLKVNASGSMRLNKWLNITVAYVYNRFTRTFSRSSQLTFGITIRK